MKRIVGALFCLLTVFLFGSGFLFNSLTAFSQDKWSDLAKVNPEEEIFEADVDSDDDLSDVFELSFGKKISDNLGIQIYYQPQHSIWNSKNNGDLFKDLSTKKVCVTPVWLRLRSILI